MTPGNVRASYRTDYIPAPRLDFPQTRRRSPSRMDGARHDPYKIQSVRVVIT